MKKESEEYELIGYMCVGCENYVGMTYIRNFEGEDDSMRFGKKKVKAEACCQECAEALKAQRKNFEKLRVI